MSTHRLFSLASLLTGLCIAGSSVAVAQTPQPRPTPTIGRSERNDTSPPLYTIRPVEPRAGELRELPRKLLPNRMGSVPSSQPTAGTQTVPGVGTTAATAVSFDGIGNVNGVLPPDTVGDVGPNHYVQAVNLAFAIWDKSGTQLKLASNINTLWSGFGGVCQTSNDGDPIVMYDHLADRWIITQFALPNYPFGPFYQCVAVSAGPDPTQSYHRYQFLISNTKMNDYPKLGVWPDGYYMTVNQFSQPSLRWAGAGVVAFERDKMLAGQPANLIYFDLFSADPNLGGMLPSDLDGPAPAAGTPNYFAEIDDDSWGYSPDQMQIWAFQANWTNPQSSTFTKIAALPTAAFDANLCGYARNCIPQPGGAAVDALSDRLMYRLQYRNFGSYQTLVTNHTVDVNGADRAGIRWYELRNAGGGWSIYQQGTYAPDANHRWMGSAAMDASGNIALGYSISSTTMYPSVRYTGRLAGDPLGQMTLAEGTIVNGSGYQQHSSGRWGDYSALSLDADGATFWFTQEYYASIGQANWKTRIGSFQLTVVTPPPPPPPPPASATSHVGDLDGASALRNNRKSWQATVTITVRDAGNAPVANATVTGAWSGTAGTTSCTTGATGTCSVNSTGNLSTTIPSVTFTVNGISHASLTYDPASNSDPDGDSNGTSITVAKP